MDKRYSSVALIGQELIRCNSCPIRIRVCKYRPTLSGNRIGDHRLPTLGRSGKKFDCYATLRQRKKTLENMEVNFFSSGYAWKLGKNLFGLYLNENLFKHTFPGIRMIDSRKTNLTLWGRGPHRAASDFLFGNGFFYHFQYLTDLFPWLNSNVLLSCQTRAFKSRNRVKFVLTYMWEPSLKC